MLLFNWFKNKKKKHMYNLTNDNGMYKLYDGEKLIAWGTELLPILNKMKEDKEKRYGN